MEPASSAICPVSEEDPGADHDTPSMETAPSSVMLSFW